MSLVTILVPGLVDRLSGQLYVCTKSRKNRYFDTQGMLVSVLEYFQVVKNDGREDKFSPKRPELRFLKIVRVLDFEQGNLRLLQAKVVFQIWTRTTCKEQTDCFKTACSDSDLNISQ